MKKKFILIAIPILLLITPLLVFTYYKIAVHRPAQMDREITVEIKSGESVSDIAANLYDEGVINSELLFSFYVFVNKLDRNIQAGVYTVRAGMSVVELADMLQHGIDDSQLTFIEGWRTEEYARAASQQFEKIDYNEFVAKALPFEGYLFPDTYYFTKEVQEDEMIATLRTTFDKKTEGLFDPAKLEAIGLTKEEVIILASIVEREISNPDDRPVVAGLLLRRLNEGMRLDADATTQYAVAPLYLCGRYLNTSNCVATFDEILEFNWWPKELTQTDLDYENTHNTRFNYGLPPTPISNPGISAIRAVLEPVESDYLYYLTDRTGITRFARTLEEHEANVLEYLR